MIATQARWVVLSKRYVFGTFFSKEVARETAEVLNDQYPGYNYYVEEQ